jgi:hypothetical protein
VQFFVPAFVLDYFSMSPSRHIPSFQLQKTVTGFVSVKFLNLRQS